MKFARVLELLNGFFAGSHRRMALIGGHALAAYGSARATVALDLVVDASEQGELIAFLEGQGYETLHRSAGYSNHLHDRPDMGRIDFVYVHGRTADMLFDGARSMPGPEGIRVSVPRPEHLAAMKLFALVNDTSRREQELADIAWLLRLEGVDREEIRGYFERHELIDDFERIAADY